MLCSCAACSCCTLPYIAVHRHAGVDYGILDDDAPHLHRRLGADDTDLDAPFMAPGMYPRGQEGEDEVRQCGAGGGGALVVVWCMA